MKKKHICVFVFVIALVFSNFIFVSAQPSDIEGHWAKDVMEKWADYGIVKGTEGLLRPNDNISRAEFVSLVSRVLKPIKKGGTGFNDVTEGQWYTEDVMKAVEAGFIQGDGKGNFMPLANITRQEAAVVLYKAFDMNPGNTSLLKLYKDYNDVALWSQVAVSALAENGYMSGKPGNLLAPKDSITRAETVTLINNIAGDLKYKAGTYTGDTKGSMVINTSGVVLKDMTIKGNLYIAYGVGDGDVLLDNVTVKGHTIVRGGGINSIKIKNSNLNGTLVVLKTDGKVRIVLIGDSSVSDVDIKGSVKLGQEDLTGEGFGNVTVMPLVEGAEIEIEGDIEELIIEAPGVDISVIDGIVGSLTVAPTAINTEIQIAKEATVKAATIEAKTEIKGTGTIEKAVIKADEVKIEQKPKTVEVAAGVKADVGGQTVKGEDKKEEETPAEKPARYDDDDTPIYLSSVILPGVPITDTVNNKDFKIDIWQGVFDEIGSHGIEIKVPTKANLVITSIELGSTQINLNYPIELLANVVNEVSLSDMMDFYNDNKGKINLDDYGEKVEKVDASVPIQYGTVKNVLKSFGVKQAKITGTLSASGYSNSTITLTIVVDNTP